MRSSRILGISLVVAAAVTATIVSCGSSHTVTDAPIDTKASGSPDAAIDAPFGGGGSALGEACTPATTPQGSCPAGYDCLDLTGNTNPWCSKRCAQGSADQCNTGYPGPGYASCDLTVTSGSGSGNLYCSVTCRTYAGGSSLCPSPATCNGSCPSTLACTGNITNGGGSGSTIANFCR